jgi:hypothetical protein
MNEFFYFVLDKINSKTKYSPINAKVSLASILDEAKKKNRKYTKEDKFFYTIILGEYLRISMNGRWLLLKRYGTYNPYFEPVIEYPNGNFVPILDRTQDFFNYDGISFDIFITFDSIQMPFHNRTNTFANDWILQ